MTDLTGLEADVVELLTGTDEDLERILGDVRARLRDVRIYADLIAWRDAAVAAERDKPGRPSRAWHADWTQVDRDSSGNAILRHKPTGGMYKILPAEEC
jgi:hypothetical protein